MVLFPLTLTQVGLTFPHKTCFTDFSTQIYQGARIAIIGRNGSGKSNLLEILQGLKTPSEGQIHIPSGITFGYVPQIIAGSENLSGGQRFNDALTKALIKTPDVLVLDEPTNHLDMNNKNSLLHLLQRFKGVLIIASHDAELLRTCVNTLWDIEDGKITVFSGNYDDYREARVQQRTSLEHELHHLGQQQKATHQALMKEQGRARNSRLSGEKHIGQRKWPTIVSQAKARRAEETSGRKKNDIRQKKMELSHKLAQTRLPEIIIPRFALGSAPVSASKAIVAIADGACGYGHPVLDNIFLTLAAGGRLGITGSNGSGKSTLAKAIVNDKAVIKSGTWTLPSPEDIGYLDQHYATLDRAATVLNTIQATAPHWGMVDIRRHLNDFLFRKNEEINACISTLSGGERARLSLAQIAASPPKLLILDEITNNLDLETRLHVTQILKPYPCALIVISHDIDFLTDIGIENFYDLSKTKAKQ